MVHSDRITEAARRLATLLSRAGEEALGFDEREEMKTLSLAILALCAAGVCRAGCVMTTPMEDKP